MHTGCSANILDPGGERQMPDRSHCVTQLIFGLDEPEYRRWSATILDLVAIGEPAVPALTQALTGPTKRVRIGAVRALGRIGHAAGAAVPALIGVVRNGTRPDGAGDPDVQAEAAAALGGIGAREAVPCLVEALRDKNYLCVCAALALGRIKDASAVAPLVGVLMDVDKFWVPRGAAAVALGNLGMLAESAIPALTTALEYDPEAPGETWDLRAREAVVDALSRITDPASPSSLTGKGFRYEMWGIH